MIDRVEKHWKLMYISLSLFLDHTEHWPKHRPSTFDLNSYGWNRVWAVTNIVLAPPGHYQLSVRLRVWLGPTNTREIQIFVQSWPRMVLYRVYGLVMGEIGFGLLHVWHGVQNLNINYWEEEGGENKKERNWWKLEEEIWIDLQLDVHRWRLTSIYRHGPHGETFLEYI